jgi:hypothetical protein
LFLAASYQCASRNHTGGAQEITPRDFTFKSQWVLIFLWMLRIVAHNLPQGHWLGEKQIRLV